MDLQFYGFGELVLLLQPLHEDLWFRARKPTGLLTEPITRMNVAPFPTRTRNGQMIL